MSKCKALGETHFRRWVPHVFVTKIVLGSNLTEPISFKFRANLQGHYRSLYVFLVRLNQYDGAEEFWVTIKESGRKTESTSYEEQHRREKEAGQYKIISAGLAFYC